MLALIMAGGSGTRFWPASRAALPKQFLKISGDKSMLRLTYERLLPVIANEDIFVVTAASQAALVLEHLPELPPRNVIIEPFGMNTAPCIALSVARLAELYPETQAMAVLPADHVIRDAEAFQASLMKAAEAAQTGALVTFGIVPEYPATGYGYIESGDEVSPGVLRVRRFKEKPDLETAQAFLTQGNFYWNSGMFCWTLRAIGAAFEAHLPQALALSRRISRIWDEQGPQTPVDAIYREMPRVPIDIGIMEPAAERVVIPVSYGWSDVGSWKALADITGSDADGNHFSQPGLALDARGNYVRSDKFVALIGVEGLCVVDTGDAILVTTKDLSEGVKAVVEHLKENEKDELL